MEMGSRLHRLSTGHRWEGGRWRGSESWRKAVSQTWSETNSGRVKGGEKEREKGRKTVEEVKNRNKKKKTCSWQRQTSWLITDPGWALTKNKNKQGRTKATRLLYMSVSSSRVEYKHFVTHKVWSSVQLKTYQRFWKKGNSSILCNQKVLFKEKSRSEVSWGKLLQWLLRLDQNQLYSQPWLEINSRLQTPLSNSGLPFQHCLSATTHLSQDFRVRLLLERDLCFELLNGLYHLTKTLISTGIVFTTLSDTNLWLSIQNSGPRLHWEKYVLKSRS